MKLFGMEIVVCEDIPPNEIRFVHLGPPRFEEGHELRLVRDMVEVGRIVNIGQEERNDLQ